MGCSASILRHKWQSGQLYAQAAYHLQGNSLVLIFLLESERNPGLQNADRKNRNRDPHCGVVPQPPLVPKKRMRGHIQGPAETHNDLAKQF
jgi:hypothetical protein